MELAIPLLPDEKREYERALSGLYTAGVALFVLFFMAGMVGVLDIGPGSYVWCTGVSVLCFFAVRLAWRIPNGAGRVPSVILGLAVLVRIGLHLGDVVSWGNLIGISFFGVAYATAAGLLVWGLAPLASLLSDAARAKVLADRAAPYVLAGVIGLMGSALELPSPESAGVLSLVLIIWVHFDVTRQLGQLRKSLAGRRAVTMRAAA